MFNTQNILANHFPTLNRLPIVNQGLNLFLRIIFHETECNKFLDNNAGIPALIFSKKVLDYFNFSYKISERDKCKIPKSGRVIIFSNHPIGTLDGFLLLDLVGSIRQDVKILANDVLSQVQPLNPVLLPVNNIKGGTVRENIKNVYDFLEQEGAVIVFPAGEVSRFSLRGLQDPQWNSGFLRMARKMHAPMLPIFITAKNSKTFYCLSFMAKTLSTLWLIREMFKHKNNSVDVKVGDMLEYQQHQAMGATTQAVNKIRSSLYAQFNRKKSKKGIVAVAPAQDRQLLKKEIKQFQLLGVIGEDIYIYLCHYRKKSALMKEIGRLREISFRAVGEGTGKKRDLDKYDKYYMHLVLWDNQQNEIVGAYRLGDARSILQQQGVQGLYTSTLFDYQQSALPIISRGLELGRSFVQPRYWGQRSLDFLWYGIGAFLRENPRYKYLFGPVSLSDHYPQQAKDLMLYFYKHYFSQENNFAYAKKPYRSTAQVENYVEAVFQKNDYSQDFKILKSQLKNMHLSVPTLYKQYTELTEDHGSYFWAFNIDENFCGCIDGLVVVDVDKIKPKKRQRYMGDAIDLSLAS